MRHQITIREHDALPVWEALTAADKKELGTFAPKVLKVRDGNLAASSQVGIITTSRGTVLEILPKIDLGEEDGGDYENTRQVFLKMLRRWRGLSAPLPPSSIRALSRYPMLEVFVRQFLERVIEIARHGLARKYQNTEENLPYLRGRIAFADHIRENVANGARFHVIFDDLTSDRAVNRLIHTTLTRLSSWVQESVNRQLLRKALVKLAEVPLSHDVHADWRNHDVDRSMPHYSDVMAWVGLFLFGQGLATFSGRHQNYSLLFPMESVYEHFVTDSLRRYQKDYKVRPQGPQKPMATLVDRNAFKLMPDVSLIRNGQVSFILDAKWKRIDVTRDYPKHEINQGDVYQLYAYARRYECATVALIYPKSRHFQDPISYRFFDGIRLLAIPFDLAQPQAATKRIVTELELARTGE